MNVVVGATETDADAVLDVFEMVVVNLCIEGFHDSNASILHVVDVVVCTRKQQATVELLKREGGNGCNRNGEDLRNHSKLVADSLSKASTSLLHLEPSGTKSYAHFAATHDERVTHSHEMPLWWEKAQSTYK